MTNERNESGSGAEEIDELDERAVYIISVAAELAGVHPQTLRIYERKGLVRPKRTVGNTRRYSDRDIRRLQMIQELTQHEGVNLAGVKLIMELQTEIDRLQGRIDEIETQLERRRAIAMPGRRVSAEIVPLGSIFRRPWEDARG
jgi:MerR family transcriptional regulator, heat shock protein HspR